MNPYQGLKHRLVVVEPDGQPFKAHESLSGIETLIPWRFRRSALFFFQSSWIPIRDWNTALPGKWMVTYRFQSSWIPIRDWNAKLEQVSSSLAAFKAHESLSGIETRLYQGNEWWRIAFKAHESLSGIETLLSPRAADAHPLSFQSSWIPIRDWNGIKGNIRANKLLSKLMNPYQGLKRSYRGWLPEN